jgi:IclR family pca regulon transcriptional regulator
MRKDDEHKHGAGESDVGSGESSQDTTGQGATGQGKTGQNTAGQDTTGQRKTGQDTVSQDTTGQGATGQGATGASTADKREAGKTKARKRKAGAGGKPAADKAGADKGGAGKTGGAGKRGAGKGGRAAPNAPAPRVRPAPDPRLSRSLEYGVAILETFSAERQELGIAGLSDIVGISRSTTHRYAATLVALGYLEQDSKRKYRLAARAADPGSAAIAAVRRDIHARAVLEELREQTGHTVSMGVLDRARVTYVHRLFGHRTGQHAIDTSLGVGASVPVYCTALGKVLLASLSDAERREVLAGLRLTRHGPNTILNKRALAAELDSISPRGSVLSDEEAMSGARSIAALVPRPSGEHQLAIDVTVPAAAYTVERLRRQIGPRVKRAARLISGE